MKAAEVLAVVQARGSSKGLPNKNLLSLLGHPLVAYSVASALSAIRVTRTIVSTDSEAIAEVARANGVEAPVSSSCVHSHRRRAGSSAFRARTRLALATREISAADSRAVAPHHTVAATGVDRPRSITPGVRPASRLRPGRDHPKTDSLQDVAADARRLHEAAARDRFAGALQSATPKAS